ncbi:protein S100-A4-like [Dendrobates tinctorius]|uniref:protein S100-A4-like n=1 Tax=Dendrobates tinctorius TaxID=92724 RepID=UPI003CC9AA08
MTLQDLMVNIILTFDKYAKGDGDCSSLSQSELFDLAKKEFPALSQNQSKDELMKGIFGKLDMDGDKKVDFKEFMIFITCLAMALKESICQ